MLERAPNALSLEMVSNHSQPSAGARADFYFYDETPDDHDLKFWQWPRIDPTADFFKKNGFCEDGLPSTTGAPSGEYHITFGGPMCATASMVASQTGAYGGCGRQDYVPCSVGRDCADCGRAALSERRRLVRTQRLPPLNDREATFAFLRTVKEGLSNGSILDFSLPWPHARVLERL